MAKDIKSKRKLGKLLYDKTPKPARETRKGKERLKKYWLALGKFLDLFASIEHALHVVLSHHMRLDPQRSRVLLSGTRASAAMDLLRGLSQVGAIRPEEWARLEPVLAQLSLINNTRNLILHYGVSNIPEGRGFATNARVARNVQGAASRPVSPTVLGRMTFDVEKALYRLLVDHTGRPALKGEHEDLQRKMLSPWRYKLPAPTAGRSQRRKSSPKNRPNRTR